MKKEEQEIKATIGGQFIAKQPEVGLSKETTYLHMKKYEGLEQSYLPIKLPYNSLNEDKMEVDLEPKMIEKK